VHAAPVTVHVHPINTVATRVDLGGPRIAAIVFLKQDAAETEPHSEAALRKRFKLTPAEAHLAVCLLQGKSLSEIWEERGVTESTLRRQLGYLFDKTGVRRQAELVRVLMSGTPQMRMDA
jgi:DNA-binding CsgD family transcriptional regulator